MFGKFLSETCIPATPTVLSSSAAKSIAAQTFFNAIPAEVHLHGRHFPKKGDELECECVGLGQAGQSRRRRV
jgi:hypothetical protein